MRAGAQRHADSPTMLSRCSNPYRRARNWRWRIAIKRTSTWKLTEADSATDWALRAIALAEPSQNIEILVQALNTLGTVRLIGGDSSGWDGSERSLQLALSGGFPERVADCYTSWVRWRFPQDSIDRIPLPE